MAVLINFYSELLKSIESNWSGNDAFLFCEWECRREFVVNSTLGEIQV